MSQRSDHDAQQATRSATTHPFAVPAHVPLKHVFDFDFHHPEALDDEPHLAWKKLHHLAPDVFWTPRNGGHWVATRAADVRRIQRDNKTFSHTGFSLPPDPVPMVYPPVTMDGQEHLEFRKLIMPHFTPSAVTRLEARAREIAIELTEKLAPKGECEFISEFATVLPIVLFLEMVDLPLTDRDKLLPLSHAASRAETADERVAATAAMAAYLAPIIEERRVNPGDDALSGIVNGQVFGRRVTHDEALMTMVVLLFGGLDTVASMLGYSARFLATHPAHRKQLVDDPGLRKSAVEELLRRHGGTNSGRLVTTDVELAGVTLKSGDRIQIGNILHGLDERQFDDPLTVDFTRSQPMQLAVFGTGAHTCPGQILARRELLVFLDEWLSRIPDFRIKEGTKPRTTSGFVEALNDLHLTWG